MISSELAMVAPNPLGLEFTIPHKPSGEERAIFDYLATYLPVDSAITADKAVQQIITLFPEELDTTGTCFIYLFWQLVFCIGSQLDYDHEPMQRFIALLRDLEILPDKIQGGAYPGRNSHSSRVYYIFTFADMWRSMLPMSRFSRSGADRQNPLGTQNSSSNFARQLQNINGMSAHMHKNGIGVNVSMYALETITKALENEELSEPYVQAAAVWFTVCPSSIVFTAFVRTRNPKNVKRVGLYGRAYHKEAIRFLDGCSGESGLYRFTTSLEWKKTPCASAGMQRRE